MSDYERYLHYHGESCARLSRLVGVEDEPEERRTLFFKVVSALLFYLPSLYFTELQKVYVDRTVHYWGWRRFISELKSDWENSITPVCPSRNSSSRPTNATAGNSAPISERRILGDTEY